MGGKMKLLPFRLSKTNSITSSESRASLSWSWPSYYCHQPRTLSFRINDYVSKTNSIDAALDYTPDSSFSNSVEPVRSDDNDMETMIRSLRSNERLFFEAGDTSRSIIKETKAIELKERTTLEKESTMVLSMESHDPYVDYRKSMEEMVEAYGLMRDWKRLEELLRWYLKVNEKHNYGYIVEAFVDMVDSSCSGGSRRSCSCHHQLYSPFSPLSFYTSSVFDDDDDEEESSSSPNCVCRCSLGVDAEIDVCSSSTPCCSSLESSN